MVDIDKFSQSKECYYKGEHYAVRDNGAVFRFPREGKRIRKDDNNWTWGTKNPQNGYMLLGSHRIHIIVAIAFYGEKDSKIYVVDHIDTNRCNNRVENLRWLTRLENVLLNPVSRKKITFLCGGDIINFIKNPSCLRIKTGEDKAFEWMRTVSAEEAQIAYRNVIRWASTPSTPNKRETQITPDDEIAKSTSISSWILEPRQYRVRETETLFYKAKSPDNALQMKWKTPTDFPCCPTIIGENPLLEYFNNLKTGTVFSSNVYSNYIVTGAVMIDNNSTILVMSENLKDDVIKPYSLSKIYFSGTQFIHESIQTFFTLEGTQKQFTLLQGLEWTGGDSIDDYC